MNLQMNDDSENCEYINFEGASKNGYMLTGGGQNEDCYYLSHGFQSKDCCDGYWLL
jgi:hypothetical protein